MKLLRKFLVGALMILSSHANASSDCAARQRANVVSLQPALVGLRLDAPTRQLLRSGARRLVLTVHAYQPGTDGLGLVASLRSGAGKALELSHFAVFPNVAFGADQPEREQRFGLPRLPAASLSHKSVCIEVKFAGDDAGGSALVSLDFEESPH